MTHVLGNKDEKEETKLSRHNYTQYSNQKKNDDETIETIVSSITDAVDTYVTPVESDTPVVNITEETVETVTLPETVKGTVTNCAKLNVRVKPTIDADVVCVLDSMSEVEVDVTRSSSDWFKICTASGVEGFCMRKYINAKL